MLNEAVKRHLLCNHDFYQAKRWEGKPLICKLKYSAAYYPEILFSAFVMLVITPFICIYKNYTYPGSKAEAMRMFKHKYTVVRDDDPDVENIMKQKELGRKHFPSC